MYEEKNPLQQKDSPRSIRMTEETFDRFKRLYTGVEGINQEVALRDLLDLRDRVILEGDQEFGSQIKQVNELTFRISEIFSSVIKQSNTKSELQVAAFEKLKRDSSDEIRDLKESLKNTKEQLEKGKKESLENWHAKHNLEREVEDLKEDKKKQTVEYEERIGELKNAIQEKDEKITLKNEKIDSLEKRIENVNRQISAHEELKQTVLQLQEEKESLLKQHAEELNNKDFELERAVFNKEKELQEGFNNQLLEQIQKTESLREQLDQKRDDLLSLRNKIMDLETQNNVLQQENTKLKQNKGNSRGNNR